MMLSIFNLLWEGRIRMMNLAQPTFRDILEARKIICRYLPRTPLYTYPQLDQLLGAKIYVKHENHMPTGAFKVRGGINLISHLTLEQKKRGVVTASTGNHAQSIAYACALYVMPATIVMPEGANPVKVKAVRAFGGDIVFHGKIFDESRIYAEQLANQRGARFIHPANEPYLLAGVATYALEIFEEVPDLDVVIAPAGGGSGASGCCLVKKAICPSAQVIAVQAEKAPAAYLSWKMKRIVTDRMETAAEGLATQVGYELTQEIFREDLSDFVLVSEEEIAQAILTYLELVRNLTEEAGAAPLAAALKIRERLRGKKVALILSGGNISLERLKTVLSFYGR